MQRAHAILATFLVTGAVLAWVSRLSRHSEPLMAVAVLGPILIAFGWLIFARSKFSIGQLMFSVFFYGGILSAVTRLAETDRQIPLAIASALGVILCLFIGARAAAKIDPRERVRHWRFFISGFLFLPGSMTSLAFVFIAVSNPGIQVFLTGLPICAIGLISAKTVGDSLGMDAAKPKDSGA